MNQQNEQQPVNSGGIFSNFGIVFAIISIVVLPIIFMPMGIIFGALGLNKGDKNKGIVAIILSVLFGILGFILGYKSAIDAAYRYYWEILSLDRQK